MGGTQSLHTNGYDEALSLPTEEAARLALRTQQIIGYESGVVDTPDPLAGSYLVESLTDEVEAKAWEYIARIDEMGGAVAAIEAALPDGRDRAGRLRVHEVDRRRRARDRRAQQVHDRRRARADGVPDRPDARGRASRQRLAAYKADRDAAQVQARLDDLRTAARGSDNLLYPMKEALRANATLGEVSDALRDVFGVYHP